LRRIGRVTLLDGVIQDDPVVVDDLGLVPELHRPAQPPLGDRASIAIVQADPPGRAVGGVALNPLPGLRDDLPRRGQQFLQLVDRADEPARRRPAAASRSPRAAGDAELAAAAPVDFGEVRESVAEDVHRARSIV